MKLAVNAVTSAPNATPINTATARSTTLPRRRNFRKPLMARTSRRRLLDASWPGTDDWSGNRQQHSGIEDADGVQRCLRREQRPLERGGALAGVPPHVVATNCVV